MQEPVSIAAVIAAYDALSNPEASYTQETQRTDAAVDSVIGMTERGELRWLFAPPRSDFYTLGHVALAQSTDGFHLIIEQVNDKLAKHYDDVREERFDHSLTILDPEGNEAFFATDQGPGWSHTITQLNGMSEQEKAAHRTYRLVGLYAMVVGDQRRNKPRTFMAA